VIALVTDSNSQITEELQARYDVRVVPLTVVVDGVAYREGVDITTDAFYEKLSRGCEISTSTPSPGDFQTVYQGLAHQGVTEIVSVHVGANTSGTISAARLGAADAPVAVEVVDSGSASFGVACCVWAAGDAIANGATGSEAAEAARDAAADLGNIFIVRSLDRARRGGRIAEDAEPSAIPVLVLENGTMRSIGSVDDDTEALQVMRSYVADSTLKKGSLRVGVGDADEARLGEELAHLIQQLPGVDEVVRYRVGPSVAAHTGLGTVGAIFYSAGRMQSA
jgi:DegV family protein with EDD domain